MNLLRIGLLLIFVSTFLLARGVSVLAGDGELLPALSYPHAKMVDQVDDYHGVNVADPYRWLEDTDSPDTRAWVEAENKLTFSYL